ncbi:MAG: M36 family metallopeptidase, partial [Flavobacteriaceae bacterium]|nr:M36 family metallopeptidase [Flavobacteriaceae bacterium]
MKKSITLFILSLFFSLFTYAQRSNSNNTSRPSQIEDLEQLVRQNPDDFIITSEHVSSLSGIRHVYVRQAISGLEVVGTESSFHMDKYGEVLSQNNNMVENLKSTVRGSSSSLNQGQAIKALARQKNYALQELRETNSAAGKARQMRFNNAGISKREIPVKLMYLYSEESGTHLVWEISVEEIDSPNYYNFYIDASTGNILKETNWTTQCNIIESHSHENSNTLKKSVLPNILKSKTSLAYNSGNGIGNYKVFAIPLESANHGPRTLKVTSGNSTSSPFGWHDTDGVIGAEYTVTQGNNVRAYRLSDGFSPDGGNDLIFDFALNTAVSPTTENSTTRNLSASITNLFYWNNIIHDVIYQYGFDEVSGNFQENNYGKNGIGSDSVNAWAQLDELCNAFFSTPPEGENPTMMMYYGCNETLRDGSLDNLVIVHEYAHGISTRLTGGAANSECLFGDEQMGEGWSDYFGLMLTMTASDLGTDARGVGTYLFGENTDGPGIRPQPYSTDFSINS